MNGSAKCLAVVLAVSSALVMAQSNDGSESVEQSNVEFLDAEMNELIKAQYQLTDEEVSKAQRLRTVDRSYGVENLSAVELLGKYARTDAERMKYARKHVTAMADNVGRSQAWGMAVYEATQEGNLVTDILAANPVIEDGLNRMRMAVPRSDYSDFDKPDIVMTEPGRTLMIKTDCGDKCDEAFAKEFVLVMENKVDHLDVVFVESTDEDTESIMAWARSMAVSQEVLKSGNVNLYVDDEEWKALRNGKDSVPRLIRK